MLLLFVLSYLAFANSEAPQKQAPGCPMPTGPYVPPKCGKNEYFEVCSFPCPTQTCERHACDPGDGCCHNACRCKDGYLRDSSGTCIPANQCGCNGDINAFKTECPNPCPPTCDSLGTTSRPCSRMCLREGCQCNEGYVLSNGTCILPKDCPGYKPCPRGCRPTCANPNPKNCDYNPRCLCKIGYILDKKCGKCIPIDQCPDNLGCNGDKNAIIRKQPPTCPSTCKSPNETPCSKTGLAVGCVCKPGLILNKIGGKCIQPDDCKGGNPCGVNGTFLPCDVKCPTGICPQDEFQSIVICDPIWPCPSGCGCKRRYRHVSWDNMQCILAEECKPLNCTGAYQRWNSCPPPCSGDSCHDLLNPPPVCQTFAIPECYPRCYCIDGYGRNRNGECVSKAECEAEAKEEQSQSNPTSD